MSTEDISMSIYDNTITPTYLYIKQHSITGLKYFGKTTNSNPLKYLGSGTYWKKHIRKHGEEYVETIWMSEPYTNKEILTEVALKFSIENNIVESNEWANLILENGLDGGTHGAIVSSETRNKISASNSRRRLSDATKQKIKNSKLNISDETRAKIGAASKNRIASAETRKKLSITSTGRMHTDETKEKIRQINLGKKHTAETIHKLKNRVVTTETKQKMSLIRKNHPIVKCPHCDVSGKGGNMTRYHFNNCKNK
jgi:hypothetical protein